MEREQQKCIDRSRCRMILLLDRWVVSNGAEVIHPLNTLAHAVRRNLGRVAFTRDWHPETTPHFDTWFVHCVADKRRAALS